MLAQLNSACWPPSDRSLRLDDCFVESLSIDIETESRVLRAHCLVRIAGDGIRDRHEPACSTMIVGQPTTAVSSMITSKLVRCTPRRAPSLPTRVS
jgi:hypothetical protein